MKERERIMSNSFFPSLKAYRAPTTRPGAPSLEGAPFGSFCRSSPKGGLGGAGPTEEK